MSEHTPEPWDFTAYNEILDANNAIVCVIDSEQTNSETVKIIHRIVQCVNACAGMENPEVEIQKLKAELSITNHAYNEMALSQTVMADSLKEANKEIKKLRADKARLVEALNEAISYLERSIEKHGRETADDLRKILTKMEGK